MAKQRGKQPPPPPPKDSDDFRELPYRYLGYAHNITRCLIPPLPREALQYSYLVTTGYIGIHAIHKMSKTYSKKNSSKEALVGTGDVLLWHSMSSLLFPGYAIDRIMWLTRTIMREAGACPRSVPKLVGLLSIPLLVHPFDDLADYVLDQSYRKWFK